MFQYLLVAALASWSAATGFCILDIVIPESGSIIVGRENQENIPIFCDLLLGGNTQATVWHIADEGEPVEDASVININTPNFIIGGVILSPNTTLSLGTNLTILSLTADLDSRVIFCGRSGRLDAANFSLRIYRPPSLLEDVQSRLIEFTADSVTVRGTPEAYPTPPQFYQWSKDGVDLSDSSDTTYEYPSVTFDSVLREDAGTYVLTARNYECEEWALSPPDFTCTQSSVVIGSDTGSFVLDVLYGPSITAEEVTFAAVVGGSVTLVCGSSPDGNPAPDIVWMDNNADIVNEMDSRYTISSDRLMLTIDEVTAADAGNWQCVLTVEDNGMIIGSSFTQLLELVVILPPGPPRELTARNIGATWIQLCWEEPDDTGTPGIEEYRIRFDGQTLDTGSSVSDFNVTGLLPNTLYTFIVAGISSFLSVSLEGSLSGRAYTTLITVPAPVCSSAPVSSDGVITVEWSYTHTGGLDLTQVTVEYRSLPSGVLTVPPGGNVTNPTTQFTSITVEDLVAGEEYQFQVTATNSIGSTTVVCPPVSHTIATFELFQVVLTGVKQCSEWILQDRRLKLNEIIASVAEGTESVCGCGFTSAQIIDGEFYCLLGTPNTVVFQALVTDVNNIPSIELLEFINQWTNELQPDTATFRIGEGTLTIDGSCPVSLTSDNSCSSLPSAKPCDSALIAGVVVGVVIVAAVMVVATIIMVTICIKCWNTSGRLPVTKPEVVGDGEYETSTFTQTNQAYGKFTQLPQQIEARGMETQEESVYEPIVQ